MSEDSISGLKFMIREKLNSHGLVLLREPIALKKKLILDNIYSEKLSVNYSAIYRTKSELINIFSDVHMSLVYDEFMHPDDSDLTNGAIQD